MNRDTEIWFETNLLGLGDSTTDAAVRALELGDHAELGRIVAAHVNTRLSRSNDAAFVAYDMTDSGYAALAGE